MRVDLPELGTFIDFPDDMSPQEIQREIDRNWDAMSTQQAQRMGVSPEQFQQAQGAAFGQQKIPSAEGPDYNLSARIARNPVVGPLVTEPAKALERGFRETAASIGGAGVEAAGGAFATMTQGLRDIGLEQPLGAPIPNPLEGQSQVARQTFQPNLPRLQPSQRMQDTTYTGALTEMATGEGPSGGRGQAAVDFGTKLVSDTLGIAPSMAATVAGFLMAGPAGAGAMGGFLEGASQYEKAKAEGKSEQKALQELTTVGVGTGVLNAIPFIKAFDKVLPDQLKGYAANFLLRGAVEGATETAEGALPPLAELERVPRTTKEATDLLVNMGAGIYDESGVFLPAMITGGLMGGGATAPRSTAAEQAPSNIGQYFARRGTQTLTQTVTGQQTLRRPQGVVYQQPAMPGLGEPQARVETFAPLEPRQPNTPDVPDLGQISRPQESLFESLESASMQRGTPNLPGRGVPVIPNFMEGDTPSIQTVSPGPQDTSGAGPYGIPNIPQSPMETLPPVRQTPKKLQRFETLFDEAAAQTQGAVWPELLIAQAQVESGGNPKAVSPKGAQGLMQFMPPTAKEMGITDPFDPRQSVMGAARFMQDALEKSGGDLDVALAIYNAGYGNVQKYGGVPPFKETQEYIRKVRSAMAAIQGDTVTASLLRTPPDKLQQIVDTRVNKGKPVTAKEVKEIIGEGDKESVKPVRDWVNQQVEALPPVEEVAPLPELPAQPAENAEQVGDAESLIKYSDGAQRIRNSGLNKQDANKASSIFKSRFKPSDFVFPSEIDAILDEVTSGSEQRKERKANIANAEKYKDSDPTIYSLLKQRDEAASSLEDARSKLPVIASQAEQKMLQRGRVQAQDRLSAIEDKLADRVKSLSAQPLELQSPTYVRKAAVAPEIENLKRQYEAARLANDGREGQRLAAQIASLESGAGAQADASAKKQMQAVDEAISSRKPVNAEAMKAWANVATGNGFDAYGNIPRRGIPAGYVQDGDVYVYQGRVQPAVPSERAQQAGGVQVPPPANQLSIRERKAEVNSFGPGWRFTSPGKRYIRGDITRDEFLAIANRQFSDSERDFSDYLSEKYVRGYKFADLEGESPIGLFSNTLEAAASKSKDNEELSKILLYMKGLPNEEEIAMALAFNPNVSDDIFVAARNSEALLRDAEPEDIRRIDERRAATSSSGTSARTQTLQTAAQNLAAIEGKAEPVVSEGQAKAFDRLVGEKPKGQVAIVAGQTYELVSENGNGTITVRNQQGDVFDTDPGEPYSLRELPPKKAEPTTRKEFIDQALAEHSQQQRDAVRRAMLGLRSAFPLKGNLPTGISHEQWALTEKARTKDQKQAQFKYRQAMEFSRTRLEDDPQRWKGLQIAADRKFGAAQVSPQSDSPSPGIPSEPQAKQAQSAREYKRSERLLAPQATTTFGIAGQRDTFEISTPYGAKVTGYVGNQDFPGGGFSPYRGEIFRVDVPKEHQKNNIGTSLMRDAIHTLVENGTETVNIHATTPSGKKLVNRLIKRGYIQEAPIRTSESGKNEYALSPDLTARARRNQQGLQPAEQPAKPAQATPQPSEQPPLTFRRVKVGKKNAYDTTVAGRNVTIDRTAAEPGLPFEVRVEGQSAPVDFFRTLGEAKDYISNTLRQEMEAEAQGDVEPAQPVVKQELTAETQRIEQVSDAWISETLNSVPEGAPGISVETAGGGLNSEGLLIPPQQLVVFRDSKGKVVTVAKLKDTEDGGLAVDAFVTDKTRGITGAKGAALVGEELVKIGATQATGMVSNDAQRFIEKMSSKYAQPTPEESSVTAPQPSGGTGQLPTPRPIWKQPFKQYAKERMASEGLTNPADIAEREQELRRVHRRAVQDAIAAGEKVPVANVKEYGVEQVAAAPTKVEGQPKQAWEMTREEFFNNPDAVRKELGGINPKSGTGFKVNYKYSNPSPAGPFTGSTIVDVKPAVGDDIRAIFGTATITSVKQDKVKSANISINERYDEAKAAHRNAIESALSSGKPVPAAVLADYPDLAAKASTPAKPASTAGKGSRLVGLTDTEQKVFDALHSEGSFVDEIHQAIKGKSLSETLSAAYSLRDKGYAKELSGKRFTPESAQRIDFAEKTAQRQQSAQPTTPTSATILSDLRDQAREEGLNPIEQKKRNDRLRQAFDEQYPGSGGKAFSDFMRTGNPPKKPKRGADPTNPQAGVVNLDAPKAVWDALYDFGFRQFVGAFTASRPGARAEAAAFERARVAQEGSSNRDALIKKRLAKSFAASLRSFSRNRNDQRVLRDAIDGLKNGTYRMAPAPKGATKETILQSARDVMSGKSNVLLLPERLQKSAQAQREFLDAASQYLLENEIATTEGQKAAVKKGIGLWLRRSYEVHDNPNWVSEVQGKPVWNAALDAMQAEWTEATQTPESLTDLELIQFGRRHLPGVKNAKALNEIEKVLAENPTADTLPADSRAQIESALRELPQRSRAEFSNRLTSILAEMAQEGREGVLSNRLGSQNRTSLMRRKTIPKWMRDVMGEYTEPEINFARSAEIQAQMIAAWEFSKSLYEAGKGTFIFDNIESIPDNLRAAFDRGEFRQVPDNAKYGMLAGKYMSKELREALDQKRPEYDLPLRVLSQISGSVRWMKTIGNVPSGYIRNFFSSMFAAASRGDVPIATMAKVASGIRAGKGFDRSMAEAIGIPADNSYSMYKKLQDHHEKMVKLGVHDTDPTANLVRERLRNGLFGKGEFDPNNPHVLRKINELATNSWLAGDNFWKSISFMENVNRYESYAKKQGWTQEQLERHAADVVRATSPTYDAAFPIVNKLKNSSINMVWQDFMTWPAERIRNKANLLKLIGWEMKSGDKALQASAAGRLVTMISSHAIMTIALGTLGQWALGGDDEDEDWAVRSLLPEWMRYAPIYHFGKTDKGEYGVLDLGFSDPDSMMNKVLLAAYEGNYDDAAMELVNTFLGTSIAYDTFEQIRMNRKQSGAPVFFEHDNAWEKLVKSARFASVETGPPLLALAWQAYERTQGKKEEIGTRTIGDRLWSFTGFSNWTINPERSFSFKAKNAAKHFRDIRGEISRESTEYPDRKLRDIEKAMADKRDKYAQDLVEFGVAAKIAGVSTANIRKQLKEASIREDYITKIMQGINRSYDNMKKTGVRDFSVQLPTGDKAKGGGGLLQPMKPMQPMRPLTIPGL